MSRGKDSGTKRESLNTSLYGSRPGSVTSEILVSIVKPQSIEPTFKSIYFMGEDNPFTFEIQDGSGEFTVHIVDSNPPNVAYLSQRGRKVTVVPKRVGKVTLEVRDAKIPDSPASYAELLVSSINRLDLQTNAFYLEKGSKVNMTATAFDSRNLPFDFDQYPKMDLSLRVGDLSDPSHVPYRVIRDQNGAPRVFEVKGKEIGNFQLNAFASYSAKIQDLLQSEGEEGDRVEGVTSDSVRIEVFPPLKFNPESLLITPHMKYTIQIEGGPRSQWQARKRDDESNPMEVGMTPLNCQMSDSSVASLDEEHGSHLREITGHKEGEIVMTCRVFHQRRHRPDFEEESDQEDNGLSIVSESRLRVRVKLVTSIEIPLNNQNAVYVGSMAKHLVVLKYNNEIFNHGVGPISYSWDSSHPSILKPDPPLKQTQ